MSKFFDYNIFDGNNRKLLNDINNIIKENKKITINPLNAFIFILGLKDKKFETSLFNSDIIPADGQSIIWAMKFLYNIKTERIAGIDLMYSLFEEASKKNYKIFLLGASQETLQKVIASVSEDYKKTIVGMQNGYFNRDHISDIIEQINVAKPNILFLGLSSPEKEILSNELKKTTTTNIILSVGGSFEILAGNKKRAPVIFQNLGLEWFYRLIQEPRRLFKRYLITNIHFVIIIIIEKWKLLFKA